MVTARLHKPHRLSTGTLLLAGDGCPPPTAAACSPSASYPADEVRAQLRPLFARVAPDGRAWTLDDDEIVVTMEKEEARPWASLTLTGNAQ